MRQTFNRGFHLEREQLPLAVGCQRKLPGVELASMLAMTEHAAASGDPEDAAVVEVGDIRLGLTVDIGPPIGSDYEVAGEIAGLHALSDLFVAGGSPRWALSVIVVADGLPSAAAAALLRGSGAACTASGGRIVGGHTMVGPETLVGLAVVGTVDRDAYAGKRGAVPGDGIFLSKPVGTGAVVRGWRHGVLDEAEMSTAIAVMRCSNAGPAVLARRLGHALTDVSGFGLLGHLTEMLGGAVGAIVEARAVPVLAAAYRVPRALRDTRWIEANADYARSRCRVRGPRSELDLLLDPQTNGPVLVAAPDTATAALLDGGFVRIGEITDGVSMEVRS